MKRFQDVLFIACTAVLTGLIAAPLLAPDAARAVEEDVAPTAPATKPTLQANGLALSLTLDKEHYVAGEIPVLTLQAANGTGAVAAAAATVRMRTLTAASLGSRMAALPRETWTQPVPLSVEAGERTTIRLDLDQALAAGTETWFEIQVGDQVVMAARLSLPRLPPAIPPAVQVPPAESPTTKAAPVALEAIVTK